MENRFHSAQPTRTKEVGPGPTAQELDSQPTAMLLTEDLSQNSGSELDLKMDEIVMRTYDRTFRFPGDERDKVTKVKTDGFVDLEKFSDWKDALRRTVSKRKGKRRQIGTEEKAGEPADGVTAESREFLKIMDHTRELFKKTES